MKSLHRSLFTARKDNTRTILVTGIVIILLQLVFHLTVDAKSLVDTHPINQILLSK